MINRNPKGALLQVNKYCNYRCKHCSQSAENYTQHSNLNELGLEEWKEILAKLSLTGMKSLRFTGGEVFLRKDLRDLCKTAQRLGFDFSFITNGILLNLHIDWLKQNKPCSIWITIYGYPKEVYDTYSGLQGGLPKVIKNIMLLLNSKIDVGLYYPLGSDNSQFVDEFINYFTKIGVKKFRFIQMMNQGRANQNQILQLSSTLLQSLLFKIQKMDIKDISIKFSMKSGEAGLFESLGFIVPEDLSCQIGLHHLWTVDSVGNVYSCCLFMNELDSLPFNFQNSLNFDEWRNWGKEESLQKLGIEKDVNFCPALEEGPNLTDFQFICPLLFAELQK